MGDVKELWWMPRELGRPWWRRAVCGVGGQRLSVTGNLRSPVDNVIRETLYLEVPIDSDYDIGPGKHEGSSSTVWVLVTTSTHWPICRHLSGERGSLRAVLLYKPVPRRSRAYEKNIITQEAQHDAESARHTNSDIEKYNT